ncbi:hypothetical protein [Photorhabdus caribbeanensis]|uniref:hypothetical protein n=1 Tax=Photorhabdus caribbeanensis TaxID=1004165 RepID=UPI001BD6C8DA|nr:hypothetical protein [Photorhabdus caribbeanensis]
MKIYWSYFAESHHLVSIKKAMEMVIQSFSLTGEVFRSEEKTGRLGLSSRLDLSGGLDYRDRRNRFSSTPIARMYE